MADISKVMEGFELTHSERQVLREAHRQTRDKREAYRINVVLLLGTGWTQARVAEALLLDEGTQREYVRRYREGGLEQLLKTDYQGSEPMLDASRRAELDAHLSQTIYLCVAGVVAHVKGRFAVAYSVQGMTDLLHRMGYSYKKPKVVPGKADAVAQEAWVRAYEELKRNKAENDPIYFMDAAHPQHNAAAACGWIKRGVEKAIKTNTGRKRININGAIDVATMEAVTRTDETINAQSTLELFKQLEAKHPDADAIYVVCDNARYYRCRLVNEFLTGSKVKPLFLPSYSPNLNLIERLWKYFRKQVLYNSYYEKFEQFKVACEGFFANLASHADALRRLLTENFHLYPPSV